MHREMYPTLGHDAWEVSHPASQGAQTSQPAHSARPTGPQLAAQPDWPELDEVAERSN